MQYAELFRTSAVYRNDAGRSEKGRWRFVGGFDIGGRRGRGREGEGEGEGRGRGRGRGRREREREREMERERERWRTVQDGREGYRREGGRKVEAVRTEAGAGTP